ncbi:hypothetical protein PL373_13365 [Tenacibaculum maritimum]|nr:hypothetical protein [Tenacibaculum maritimum]MDB0600286.1 hypothetical protein [Tenacibaculum maritimum]MDB0602118.1 hypothetical protein [Tenacibaculum maritimum]MDB0610796.1 hypothetical protein [Tenacibaculum maritimum]
MKLLNKTPKEIYNHCKQVVLEKSKHTKLEIQKAQQKIDEYLSTGTIIINKFVPKQRKGFDGCPFYNN